MTTTLFLPVYRVAFAYQIRQGRSWTPLEHLLLWKLAEGRQTTEGMAEEARQPVRVIVGALINLMQVGWVQIATAGERLYFETSELGRRVLKSRELPPEMQLRKRGMTLLMDRVCNEFLTPEDVTLVHHDRIPPGAHVIEPAAFKLTVGPGSCLDRLDVRANEVFEQWIDYRITSQQFYAQITVGGGELRGLPAYVSPALRGAIIDAVGTTQTDVTEDRPLPMTAIAGRAFGPISFSPDDLVVGGPAHRDLIEKVIGAARTTLLIHSCFISAKGVHALVPGLVEAARRGVRIDLLWGIRQADLDDQGRADLAAALAVLDSVPTDVKARISISDAETGSHAKVIIADTASGRYEAIVGSCNWLSTVYSNVEISLRTTEPWLVGEIAALLASLRMPPSGRWSQEVHRLVKIRNACFAAKRPTREASARLVLDGEHLLAIREARDQAHERITAGCDLFGKAAEISAFVPMKGAATETKVELIYANVTKAQQARETEAITALKAAGIILRRGNRLHGKFLLWDVDDLIVTSFNWLATMADPWKPKGAEIGVHVRAAGAADALLDKLIAHIGTPEQMSAG